MALALICLNNYFSDESPILQVWHHTMDYRHLLVTHLRTCKCIFSIVLHGVYECICIVILNRRNKHALLPYACFLPRLYALACILHLTLGLYNFPLMFINILTSHIISNTQRYSYMSVVVLLNRCEVKAYCMEIWSFFRIFFPAFEHYLMQLFRTSPWTWHAITFLDQLSHVTIMYSWIW